MPGGGGNGRSGPVDRTDIRNAMLGALREHGELDMTLGQRTDRGRMLRRPVRWRKISRAAAPRDVSNALALFSSTEPVLRSPARAVHPSTCS
jgi:hypothetical protein